MAKQRFFARAADDPREVAVTMPDGKTRHLRFKDGYFDTDDEVLIAVLEGLVGDEGSPVLSSEPIEEETESEDDDAGDDAGSDEPPSDTAGTAGSTEEGN